MVGQGLNSHPQMKWKKKGKPKIKNQCLINWIESDRGSGNNNQRLVERCNYPAKRGTQWLTGTGSNGKLRYYSFGV
jgi:hypothetical protein